MRPTICIEDTKTTMVALARSELDECVGIADDAAEGWGEVVMMCPRIRILYSCAVLLSLAAGLPRPVAAQQSPEVTMPLVALREIASDFDTGKNTIYCYYGSVLSGEAQVHIDSLRVVSSPSQCGGVGFGFISRIADRSMVMAMLGGLIASHPSFRIVSAFYGAEMIDVHGQSVRAARALSLFRAAPLREAVFGS